MKVINCQKLSSNAKIPVRATSGAAGFDLFAAQSKTIPPGGRECVFLDIKVNIIKTRTIAHLFFRWRFLLDMKGKLKDVLD